MSQSVKITLIDSRTRPAVSLQEPNETCVAIGRKSLHTWCLWFVRQSRQRRDRGDDIQKGEAYCMLKRKKKKKKGRGWEYMSLDILHHISLIPSRIQKFKVRQYGMTTELDSQYFNSATYSTPSHDPNHCSLFRESPD